MNPFEVVFVAMIGAVAGGFTACLMVVLGTRRFLKSLEKEMERLKKKEREEE